MGCSTSKASSRKRTARESWYTPLSRSSSAPLRYVPEVESDDSHLQGSPSTVYSLIQREAAMDKANRGTTLAMMLQEDSAADHSSLPTINGHDVYSAGERDPSVYACEARKRYATTKAHAKYNSKLKPVEEGPERDHAYDVETINTWELMKGLDEDKDEGSRTASPVRMAQTCSVFEKSLSYNAVHGLYSCFAEMCSPVWHVGSAMEDAENGKLGSKQNETTETSHPKSPWRTPLQSPLKSPIRSPSKSPSTPLFDLALLAKFEQAIDASMQPLPHGEWLRTQSLNEGSRTTSSSSSNETWVSSETSSDGEGGKYAPKRSPSRIAVLQATSAGIFEDMQSFEPSCPPQGEDKVVLYFTSLRGVRKTFEECCVLRRILQGLGVCVDERDVWMHSGFREELTELMGNKGMQVPRLFIKGRYIGGMEDVCQLHEDGFLIRLIEGLPRAGMFRKACEGCGGVRFVPCITCRGSCKVVDEEEGSVIRCSKCNENGLIMCPLCN